ncbi:hypothetical protein Hanom_Chr04g00377171 [Helianthus anomalus]
MPNELGGGLGKEAGQTNQERRKSTIRMQGKYTMGCRKTIKLNEEPNTIKTHASAHCLVVNSNDESNHVCRIAYEL